MANALLTPQMITREALRLFKNSNLFLRNIDTQYDDSFAKTGARSVTPCVSACRTITPSALVAWLCLRTPTNARCR